MKIDELIEELKEIREKHGNLKIKTKAIYYNTDLGTIDHFDITSLPSELPKNRSQKIRNL